MKLSFTFTYGKVRNSGVNMIDILNGPSLNFYHEELNINDGLFS